MSVEDFQSRRHRDMNRRLQLAKSEAMRQPWKQQRSNGSHWTLEALRPGTWSASCSISASLDRDCSLPRALTVSHKRSDELSRPQ